MTYRLLRCLESGPVGKDHRLKNGVARYCAALLGLAAFMMPGCAVLPKKEQTLTPFSAASPGAEEPRAEAPRDVPSFEANIQADQLIFFEDAKGSLTEEVRANPALAAKTMTLAFVNAPAADVARAVISEALGQTVAVASGVSGTVTLSVREPIPASEALSALEAVLAESGLVLLRADNGFLLITLADAGDETPRLNRPGTSVGYGVAFAPVRYAAPSAIIGLIRPFMSSRVTMTADDARGAILLRGPQTDIAAAKEAVETFDIPHLLDRMFGMFRVQFTDATTLAAELRAVLDASTDAGDAMAELLPLPRLNLLFVITRSKESFDEVRVWLGRLDQPSGGDARRLRYYPVQHTNAQALAAQLGAVFSGTAQTFQSASPERTDSAVQPSFRNLPAMAGGDEIGISTDVINNALIIRATDQEYREILNLIERMDIQAPQVLIEATLAEVTLNDDLSFGVRWFLEGDKSLASFTDNSQGAIGSVFPAFNYSFIDADARVTLSALSSVTQVSVLSAPSIVVLNNQTANLQVGDEVPIVTQQAQSVIDPNAPLVSTLQLRETGVILDVKPRINASDIVVLEIAQEVSDAVETRTSGINSPTIQQRKFTSTVAVKNNGTVALGGLIRETYADSEIGVPFLSKLPGIGDVFKSRDISKRRTELVIFLTPRIIRTSDDAQTAIHYIQREMSQLGAAGAENK
ncbi:MAG: type II secretion system secretin GspD [Amphiplicatus sp.]